jgi:SAM-dependent methyltransferase
VLGDDLLALLGGRIPADHSRQVLAEHYIGPSLARVQSDGPPRVLDLGCGAGDSVDAFRAHDPAVRWVGLDVPGSPEAAGRTRADAEFAEFDGREIPFGDEEFDVVFCKQVLEHVADPAPLLAEVRRVLAPGGALAGSTSQLEPYHSLSVANLTPYGLDRLVDGAGLRLLELRPGIDAPTLLAWRATGTPRFFGRWWGRESPFNRALGLAAAGLRRDHASRNALKLVLCGQFAFLAERPRDGV